MAFSTSANRVAKHTPEHVNRRIAQNSEARIRRIGTDPTAIALRLGELDAEWDIERAIEANASTLAFIGTGLGFFVHPYWLLLPALVTAFLFQHAVQGWCPPVPILRRLGFRTAYEIERERQALKILRGDFSGVHSATDRVRAAFDAVES